ncbi:LamG-like jellyroll fold domain-containing protein [Paenibacillus aceris]|uniref:Sucrose-6-phosphate hydrolase SacC (GH32 family) n=1 Tax=Paenibacillus aceris TaxID=869555 RepID=A0ABS4I7S3_9BACL|nr:LamG-like jellyroll fold domain-containing protein [Paenibacillus aceris]MBP1966740.1 sucrose-6-phosphate hydrolase SacC (GH32 family) [Paenibacillus aceris]NHW35002.1 hypothetical protein [Paenibacillus aceris]
MRRTLMIFLVFTMVVGSMFNFVKKTSVVKADSENPVLVSASSKLVIPNGSNIRGNITLPSQLDVDGSKVNVTWQSSDPLVITDKATGGSGEIPAGVVKRQATDQNMILTANLELNGDVIQKIFPVTVKKSAQVEAYKGYIYTYFRANLYGNGESQQIHLASSKDGLFWDDMNKNEPILTSTLGTKGVRDSFIVRSPEGDKFYLIATDLDANGGNWGAYATAGSKSIMVWESDDLINWSDQRMIKIAPDNAGNMWAPETIYDPTTGEYVVYWASNVGGHSIYYAKTRDFWTFTEPAIYKAKTASATYIDTNMIENNGKYYRFTKNENDLTILLEKSNSVLGNFELVGNKIAGESGVEGPASFKLNGQDKWILLMDGYTGSNSGVGFFPLIAESAADLDAGNFRRLGKTEFRMPTGAKHGGIIPVTQKEYDAVMAKWGKDLVKPVAPDTGDQLVPDLQYKFDETLSGNTVVNTGASGTKNNGTLYNGAVYKTDADKGKVLNLGGGNANTNSPYFAFPQGYFDGKDQVSIIMDIKSEMDNQFFFTFGVGQDNQKYVFLRTRANEIYSALTVKSNPGEQKIVSAQSPSIKNTWTNIAIVLDRNADGIHSTMRLYKDGVLLGQLTDLIANLSTMGPDLKAYLGKAFYSDPYFKGSFDNVRVYNRALTDVQVNQVFNQTSWETPGDADIVNQVLADLTIPNANDVRGNMTLPTRSAEGATITWQTDRADVVNVNEVVNANYDAMPGGVVTRQNTDTQVTLTATVSYGTAVHTKQIPLTVKAKVAKGDYKGYLFAHFTGESATGEQIYFGSSKDGLHWQNLNDGEAVLTSDIGEKGVRDPYILRSAEGDKFYILATDLRIASGKGWGAAMNDGSKSLIIWESTDLVNWSKPRMAEVGPPDSGFTWAPEAMYDEKTGEYVVFWASNIKNSSGGFDAPNIYYAKTRDFYTFTKPTLYIDRPGTQGIIDTTMIKDADGKYYRYSGDGQITIEGSDQILGTWSTIGTLAPIGLTGSDVEGPLIYKFNDRNEWNLMVDQYATGKGYLPLVTSDLSSGNFRKLTTAEYNLDANTKRHGAVLNITQEEYDAVMAKWGIFAREPVEDQQEQPILAYNFDETMANGQIQDTSGNNYTGTLNGNATYVTDQEKNSKVLYLDGTTNTFAAFPTGFFEGRNTVSISMDIKPETVTGNFFTFTIGKNNQKYMFLRTRDTEIRNAITKSTYSSEQEAKAATASIKSKWMNIKLVITPTSMTIYKDGVLFAQNNNVSVSISDFGRDVLAYLGKSFYPADPYFKGYFDNVKVYNRALTASEINGPSSEKNTAVLKGAASVGGGQSLELTYGVSNVTSVVYANDLRIHFDPAKLQFVSVEAMRDGVIVADSTDTSASGVVRLLLSSLGSEHAFTGSADLLKIKFKAASSTTSATSSVSLSDVVVANHLGVETNLNNGNVLQIQINPTVDKASLLQAISSAQSLYASAAEGTQIGQYPVGSKAALNSAITAAQAVADSANANQQDVNSAIDRLNAAVLAFRNLVNTAQSGDLNNDGKYSIGDLAIAAIAYGQTSSSANWEAIKHADLNHDGKIDILDLAAIARLILE